MMKACEDALIFGEGRIRYVSFPFQNNSWKRLAFLLMSWYFEEGGGI
jgi:hypothetical protein